MLVLPTSVTSAIILEQPLGSPFWVIFGYVTVALFAACGYCAWEMLLASLSGRAPSRTRWVVLLISAALFGAGILVDAYVTAPVVFNEKLETTWGFALSPWFFVLFIPFAAVLVVLRLIDAVKVSAFGRIPGVVWWSVGLILVMAYAIGALWSGGRSADMDRYATAGGIALAIAALGSLIAGAVLRRGGRGAGA